MAAPTILILPGWQDSGPKHWQSLWLKKYPTAVKVEQRDWMNSKKEEWVAGLDRCIRQHSGEEIVLVGHSLACATIAHWSKECFDESTTIRGGAARELERCCCVGLTKRNSRFCTHVTRTT